MKKIEPCGIATLITDFGLADQYVGAMKGVILSSAPRATLIDISHEVPPHDRIGAGYLLEQTHAHFPEGTIHLVVVDPGVGTARSAVMVRTRAHFLVGPDNGCLDGAIRASGIEGSWEIVRSDRPTSPTFHGRDLFAPLVGRMLAGHDPAPFVKPIRYRPSTAAHFHRIVRSGSKRCLLGRVIWIDRFGNVVTGIRREHFGGRKPGPALEGEIGGAPVHGLFRTYQEADSGAPFFLWGSGDYLEISMRERSAASELGVRIGCTVKVTL